jgi:predicted dehydrogenase
MSELNIGLIGSGIMGKAYSVALRMVKAFFGGDMTDVCIKALSTTREDAGRAAARDLGIEEWTGDWREIVERERTYTRS